MLFQARNRTCPARGITAPDHHAVKNFLAYTLRRLGTIAIAWALSRGEDVVPLVGARRRERLEEALGAPEVALDADDLARIEEAIPVGAAAGERYHAEQMAILDSERD